MQGKVRQSAEGEGNIQVGRDFHQINILNIMNDPSFTTDIDQAIKHTTDGLETLQESLDRHDAFFMLLAYFLVMATATSFYSALHSAWVIFASFFSIVILVGLQMNRQARRMSILRIDRDAHKEVLSTLCRHKVITRLPQNDIGIR